MARWEITCPGGLVGKTLGVDDIATSGADVLLRVTLPDGRSVRRVLTADQPTFRVPGAESKLQVVRGYTLLGVEHILGGLGPLALRPGPGAADGPRAETALDDHRPSRPATASRWRWPRWAWCACRRRPIEAAIALSIYLLAVELVRSRAGTVTLMQRAPWLVAGGFGLLHGLGFAGALAAVGLPQGEIPLALFAFNVGIELGQLAFVAVVLVVMAATERLQVPWPQWAPALPAYGIGSLAIYWFLERLARQVVVPRV